MRSSCVHSAVYLLHCLGTARARHADVIVSSILKSFVHEKSSAVNESLSRAVGPLTCVLCKNTVIDDRVSSRSGTQFRHSLSAVDDLIICSDDHCIQVPTRVNEKKSLRNIDCELVDLLVPFLTLLRSDSVLVRLGFTRSFCRLFSHILGRSKDILNAALDLLTDKDVGVRYEVYRNAKYFVLPGATELTMLTNAIVEQRLWQAYAHWNNNDDDSPGDDEKDAEVFLKTAGEICKVCSGVLMLNNTHFN